MTPNASSEITATRYHDFSCGHRVAGHESKCAHLHGHNYRVHFTCAAQLDEIGRVLDFSEIKSRLCAWLEERWDHRFLYWSSDDAMLCMLSRLPQTPHLPPIIGALSPTALLAQNSPDRLEEMDRNWRALTSSFVQVSFNPTAENMARYLLEEIAPQQLAGSRVMCIKVVVEETRKCSAAAELVRISGERFA